MDEFTSKVIRGQTPSSTPPEVASLIDWIAAHHANKEQTIILKGQNISTEIACRLGLVYIDHNLLVHESDPYLLFGLTPDADKAEIRARYRRLLQIFHPDRHPDDQQWFTDCSGKINRAYAALKIGSGAAPVPVAAESARPYSYASEEHQAPKAQNEGTLQSEHTREAEIRNKIQSTFGSSRQLKTKIYTSLFLIPAIAITLVYLNNQGITDEPGDYKVGEPEVPVANTDTQPNKGPSHRDSLQSEDKTLSHTERAIQRLTQDEEGLLASRQSNQFDRQPSLFTLKQEVADVQTDASTNPEVTNAPQSKAANHITTTELAPDKESQLTNKNRTQEIDQITIPTLEDVLIYVDKSPTRKETSEGVSSADATTAAKSQPLSLRTDTAQKPVQLTQVNPPPVQQASIGTNTIRSVGLGGTKTLSDLVAERKIVKELLDEFQAAYNGADVPRLMNLFHESVTSRNGTTKADIKSQYITQFSTNVGQDLHFKEFKVDSLGKQQYKTEVNYFLEEEWVFPKNFKRKSSGVYKLHLVEIDETLKIWRLE